MFQRKYILKQKILEFMDTLEVNLKMMHLKNIITVFGYLGKKKFINTDYYFRAENQQQVMNIVLIKVELSYMSTKTPKE